MPVARADETATRRPGRPAGGRRAVPPAWGHAAPARTATRIDRAPAMSYIGAARFGSHRGGETDGTGFGGRRVGPVARGRGVARRGPGRRLRGLRLAGGRPGL